MSTFDKVSHAIAERGAIAAASERVRTAAQMVERYAHQSRPELDRELARAMASYFELVESYFGRDPQILAVAS